MDAIQRNRQCGPGYRERLRHRADGIPGWARNHRGSAAVEFALVGPLFILLLMALVVYGGWFWLAQSVQHLAAEGARAGLAGLNTAERRTLAEASIRTGATHGPGLDPAALSIHVDQDGERLLVEVRYDASGHPVMALAGLVPAPPTEIRRHAVIRTGGY